MRIPAVGALLAGALSFGASLAKAQPQVQGGTFRLTLTMPDSTTPPPTVTQVNPETLSQLFSAMDADHDQMLSAAEFDPWVAELSGYWSYVLPSPVIIHQGTATFQPTIVQIQGTAIFRPTVFYSQGTWTPIPVTVTVMPGTNPPESIAPECPTCSAELADLEQRTQFPDMPCDAGAGTLRLRTVCNTEGFNSQTIYLPDGRDASCFRIEAQTGHVEFAVYNESDPGTVIYNTRREGLADLGLLRLRDTGTYRIDLDMAASDAGARVSVACVSHPE